MSSSEWRNEYSRMDVHHGSRSGRKGMAGNDPGNDPMHSYTLYSTTESVYIWCGIDEPACSSTHGPSVPDPYFCNNLNFRKSHGEI